MGEVFAARYELIDPIGRGGAGAVWRAWDHRRRRYVAAKVLLQSDAHTLLRFVREQALRIDHPHVLAPASWAADDDKVLFTMDLVSGGSLAHLIGDYGPLPPTFVCTLLDQLLSGLSAVHAEDVVHRDIKPANLLLEATGTGRPHLRLSDFGISMRKGEPRLTETNYVVGTPGYFSPEQMLGAEPDFPADLYAVGLVALYLLSGKKPDAQALVEAYSEGVPSAPQGVPEPLWQVLATLLHPDPDARFRTATGVRKALAGAAELLSTDATLEQEVVEVFDHLGPLPEGFGPDGPCREDGTAAPDDASQAAPSPAASGAAQEIASRPARDAGATVAPPPETGSYHLAPPAPAYPQASEQAGTPPAPTPTAVPTPSHAFSPGPAAPSAPPPGDPTAYGYPQPDPYAVQHPPAMPAMKATPTGPVQAVATSGGTPVRRPGPPPKVAAAVLALALLCFAVGIWAMARS